MTNPLSAQTWTQTSAPTTNWQAIAASADGSKLVAVVKVGGIYVSTNYGATWVLTAAPITNWTAVASSADGRKIFAANYQGGFYTSTNSGATWVRRMTNAVGQYWVAAASSSDGNKLAAADYFSVSTSTNSGATWTNVSVSNQKWLSLVSSADGSKLFAMSSWAIYASTNSGMSWNPLTSMPKGSCSSLAGSADGRKLVAAYYQGGIYTSCSQPTPRLHLAPSSNKSVLSWIVPSANFVLQQRANLSGWLDVTNPPVLNLTNLQNEVILSPTGSSGFCRLKTP